MCLSYCVENLTTVRNPPVGRIKLLIAVSRAHSEDNSEAHLGAVHLFLGFRHAAERIFLDHRCTPVSALNSNVSCESFAVPEYHPVTERLPIINDNAETVRGSSGAAGTTRLTKTSLWQMPHAST